MSKPGGPGAGGGPTAAAAAAAAQKQKSLLQRVDTDIANIVDNFSFLVNVARVRSSRLQSTPCEFQIRVSHILLNSRNPLLSLCLISKR